MALLEADYTLTDKKGRKVDLWQPETEVGLHWYKNFGHLLEPKRIIMYSTPELLDATVRMFIHCSLPQLRGHDVEDLIEFHEDYVLNNFDYAELVREFSIYSQHSDTEDFMALLDSLDG